jgi:hypothetical protein
MLAPSRRLLRIIVALVLWGLITHGTYAGSGDEPHYLAITHSIAFDFDLNLANNYGTFEPLIGGGNLAADQHVRTLTNGVVRPVHDIGMPLVFAPLVRVIVPFVNWSTRHLSSSFMQRSRLTPAVLYRQTLSIVMIGLATVLAGLIFDALVSAGNSPAHAVGVSLLIMLSPPLLFYSVLFFTELLSALVCFWTFRRVTWVDIRGTWPWALTGAAIGFLMLIHARNAGLVIGLAALGVTKSWRMKLPAESIALVTGMAVLLLVRTAVNYYFWGTLVTNSHASLGAWTGWSALTRESLTRLAGLMLDQEYGLLIYAPLYALAVAGLIILAKTNRAAAVSITFVVTCYVALVICPLTNVQGWTGQWCPAGRFLTPVLPLFAIPLSFALRSIPRPVAAAVLALQIGISATLWQFPKLAWNDGDGRAAFCVRTGEGICHYLPSLVGS